MSNSKHKILFISPQPFFDWRGSPIRVSFTLRALVSLGYEVDFLTFPVGYKITIPGVRIIRVPNIFFVKNVAIGPSWAKAGLDVLVCLWALALAMKHRYLIIHGIEEAGVIGLLARGLKQSSLIFEKHSDPNSFRKGWCRNLVLAFYGFAERFIARRADAVICTGPGLVKQIRGIAEKTCIYHIFDIPSSFVESKREEVRPFLTTALKVDKETNMGIVGDIKQELRKVNALKINYTTRIGDVSLNKN